MNRKFLVIGIVLLLSLASLYSTIYASSFTGTMLLDCTGVSAGGPISMVLDRDNTGTGEENIRIDITDGAGTVLNSGSAPFALGTYTTTLPVLYGVAPQYNPIILTITSLAGNGFDEQVLTVQQGECEGLPTHESPSAPGVATGCRVTLPAGSVVGDMPFDTQAYWAPGQESPGVIINAGTYYVLGTDETGGWYKVILSCRFLWVPVNNMQPSYQPPQNGLPLPTGIVS